MNLRYLKAKPIKADCHAHGKQVSQAALAALDSALYDILQAALMIHNGGSKRVSETVIAHVVHSRRGSR